VIDEYTIDAAASLMAEADKARLQVERAKANVCVKISPTVVYFIF
jgi:hypothetical protein